MTKFAINMPPTSFWLAGYLITLGGLAFNQYWQKWATEYRATVANELYREFSIKADFIIGKASRKWLPWPWEAADTTLKDNIIEIEKLIQPKMGALLKSDIANSSWLGFKTYVLTWEAGNKMCRLAQSFTVETDLCRTAEQLPQSWVNTFNNNFDQSYYLNNVEDQLVFGARQAGEIRFCNTSPVAINSTVLQHVASPGLSNFYQTVMQRRVDPYQRTESDIVMPGECRLVKTNAFDVALQAAYQAVPNNPQLEGWFFEKWKKYYAKWLDNPEQYEQLSDISRDNIATTLCHDQDNRDPVDNGINFGRFEENNCKKGLHETYLYGLELAKPNQLFFAANYPGFSDYDQYVMEDGTVNQEQLDAVLQKAQELAPIVDRQYRLAQKWDSTSPRFELGANLDDTSGPFEVGVDATEIPQTTILGDFIEIPESGMIYEINGQAIYSEVDIYETLAEHGDSKGIMSPITVGIYNESAELTEGVYTTRYRFNPKAQQHFDTDVSSLELGGYGLLFNSTFLTCGVKSIFTDLGGSTLNQCAWIDDQRFAFTRQMNQKKYDSAITVGQIGGAILVPGIALKAFRAINGARRLSFLSEVLMAGTAEALSAAAYADSELPPQSLATEERLALTVDAAKGGFLWGSAFALIPR